MMKSLSGKEIKFLKSLSQKKFRDEYGLFTVEGDKMVDEALKSGYDVTEVYRRDEIGEEQMSRISLLSSPSPSLAVVRKPSGFCLSDEDIQGQVSSIILSGKSLSLALDGVRDPGNMGTIIRIADWFGLDAVFASGDSVDFFNPKVVQATMGAVFRMKLLSCSIVRLCREYGSLGQRTFGTFLDGDCIYSCSFNPSGLIIMGNEANGISQTVAGMVSDRLFIPPYPSGQTRSESLNVAVATAITVSEFRRRG